MKSKQKGVFHAALRRPETMKRGTVYECDKAKTDEWRRQVVFLLSHQSSERRRRRKMNDDELYLYERYKFDNKDKEMD